MRNTKAFLILPLRSALFVLSSLLIVLVSNKELAQISRWWSVICSVCNVITLIVLWLIYRREHISYRQLINWEKGRTKPKTVLFAIFFILIVGIGGLYASGFFVYGQFPYLAAIMIAPIPLWLAAINLFVLPLTTTMAEDGLYLGYSLNRISNKWQAILLPAFFYAIQHSFIPLLFDMKYILYRFMAFLPLTIALAYWYHKKRNPVPIMAGHFVINMATAVQIILTSASPEFYEAIKVF